jgi:hypothetical protein
MTAREKGLQECRKVKKVLEKMGFAVEGPGYKPMFIPKTGKMTVVHKDYFGIYDLLIMGRFHIFGVQVTTDAGNRMEKARTISEGHKPLGFVWYPIKKGYEILAVKPTFPVNVPGVQEWTLEEFKEKMDGEI